MGKREPQRPPVPPFPGLIFPVYFFVLINVILCSACREHGWVLGLYIVTDALFHPRNGQNSYSIIRQDLPLPGCLQNINIPFDCIFIIYMYTFIYIFCDFDLRISIWTADPAISSSKVVLAKLVVLDQFLPNPWTKLLR